jgi:hypothetical protein
MTPETIVRHVRAVGGPTSAFTVPMNLSRIGVVCQRLVRERLYDAACFVTSSKDPNQPINEPDAELGFANFVAAIAGRAAYIKALGS